MLLRTLRSIYQVIALPCLGAVLIALAIWISESAAFAPAQLFQGDAWSLGPRELAHFVGYAGCVLLVWCALRFYANDAARWLPQVLGGIGLAILLCFYFGSIELKAMLGTSAVRTLCQLLPVYLGACYLMHQVKRGLPNLLRPAPALSATAVLLLSSTLIWEGVVQPFFEVYGSAPRGYIQIAQILCDVAGIVIGACLIAPLVQQTQKSGSTFTLYPSPDFPNTDPL